MYAADGDGLDLSGDLVPCASEVATAVAGGSPVAVLDATEGNSASEDAMLVLIRS